MIDYFDPARVGACAGVEQSASCADESVGPRAVEPEVSRKAKMCERVPAQRPALGRGAGRVAREESSDGSLVGEDRGSVNAARRYVRVRARIISASSSVPDLCPCRGEQAASMNREVASSREATSRLKQERLDVADELRPTFEIRARGR